jgi:prolyl-tRNA editing enzyme YbaK/EbsC (Cys-tRNA(Pro) deacylase)
MHPNVARVVDAAALAGLRLEVRRFPEGTRTAADAARAVGCEVAQIVKSLVFVDGGRPVVALVSGANRVDLAKLARAAGVDGVRRADGDEVRSLTGFAIGGVPPFAHATPATVLVDRDLAAHSTVWAAAGLPDAVFPVAPDDLLRASGGTLADLAEAPGEPTA